MKLLPKAGQLAGGPHAWPGGKLWVCRVSCPAWPHLIAKPIIGCSKEVAQTTTNMSLKFNVVHTSSRILRAYTRYTKRDKRKKEIFIAPCSLSQVNLFWYPQLGNLIFREALPSSYCRGNQNTQIWNQPSHIFEKYVKVLEDWNFK